jgi:hypothetical protein
LAVDGGHAYVAVGDAGLWILSLEDPAQPREVTTVATKGEAINVIIDGEYALVAAGDRGLRVVWVADPQHAREVGDHIETPGRASGLTRSENHVYLADGPEGMHVIDFNNPLAPEVIGSLPLSGFAHDVVVSGDHAYVATGSTGIQVVSVAEPQLPLLERSLRVAGTASSLCVAPDEASAFVAAHDGGVFVLSLQPTRRIHLPALFRSP